MHAGLVSGEEELSEEGVALQSGRFLAILLFLLSPSVMLLVRFKDWVDGEGARRLG